MKPRTTALGYFIGIHPVGNDWYCVAYNGLGQWRASCKSASLDEAKAERRKWFKNHREIAKGRESKRRRNK